MEAEELQGVPLFASLPADEMDIVAANLSRAWVHAGKNVAKEGDFAYKFSAILSGEATVSRDGEVVATLGEGDVFGEMALPADHRRNANVVAMTELHMATMLSWDFRTTMESCPTFKSAIDALIDSRS